MDSEQQKEMESTLTPLAPFLFSLPRELKDGILSELGYHDLVHLRQVCRAATELVPYTMIQAIRAKLKDALLNEERVEYDRRQVNFSNFLNWSRAFPQDSWPDSSDYAIGNIHANMITRATRLTCYVCLQNLPRECFTDAQAMGSRSLGHRDAHQRFCKACGVGKGIWELGTFIKDAKQSWLICRGCKSMQKADPRYKQAGVCSTKCLERVQAARTPKIPEESAQPTGACLCFVPSSGQTSSGKVLENRSTSTREDRCMRCWMRNHTRAAANDELGLHLCKSCEGTVDHVRVNIFA